MTQDKESGSEPHRIVVVPNISLSNRGALGFFLLVTATAGFVGGRMTAQGFWPVLLFTLVTLILLAVSIYRVQRRRRYREVITLDGDRLWLERGRGRPEQSSCFNRAWVRVELEPPLHRNHPVRLFLREGRQQQEIGQCLPEEERISLGKRLKGLLATKD